MVVLNVMDGWIRFCDVNECCCYSSYWRWRVFVRNESVLIGQKHVFNFSIFLRRYILYLGNL